MTPTPTQASAVLLGVAVGDALGWPFEMPRRVVGRPEEDGAYHRWRRRAGTRFHRYEETVPSGSYSDDTQLSLAVARSLLREAGWFEHLVAAELPTWRLYERGGGGTVLRSAAAWAKGTAPWLARGKDVRRYFQSGANGTAMRIAPHALAQHSDEEQMLRLVITNSVATHGHPRALVGAALQAWNIGWALGADRLPNARVWAEAALDSRLDAWGAASLLDHLPSSWHEAARSELVGPELFTQAAQETEDLLRVAVDALDRGAAVPDVEVLQRLGALDKATNGAGHVCAVAALYLASRYAVNPRLAITTAARQDGADTDTLASMTGALVAALVGHDAVAFGSAQLQDAELIERLAAELPKAHPESLGIPDRLEPQPQRAVDMFKDELLDASPESMLHLPDERQVTIVKVRALSKPDAGIVVTGHYGRAEDGQGLVLITRRKRSQPAPAGELAGNVHRPTGRAARLAAVEVEVLDLRRTEAFYTSLGLPVVRSGRSVTVGNWVTFLEASTAGQLALDVPPVALVLDVDDVDSAGAKLTELGAQVERDGGRLRARDPNGIRLVIVAPGRRTRASPTPEAR